MNYSELRLYSRYQGISKSPTPELAAWMTEAGIYWGHLVFGSQEFPGKPQTNYIYYNETLANERMLFR